MEHQLIVVNCGRKKITALDDFESSKGWNLTSIAMETIHPHRGIKDYLLICVIISTEKASSFLVLVILLYPC